MRIIKNRTLKLYISILALFIIGEFMGYVTIRTLFLKYEMNELLPQAQMCAKDYANGSEIKMGPGRIIAVYDKNKNEIVLDTKINILETLDLSDVVDSYYDKVFKENIIITEIKHIKGLESISAIIGVPIEVNEKNIGVLFMMIPVNEYEAALHGFAIIFAITTIIGISLMAVFFWNYYKEKSNLHQIKNDYITNINHELKSPIASIRALSETLSDGLVEDEETRMRYYQIMCNESRRLETMVLDSLKLSKLQNMNGKVEKEKINLKDLLEPIVQKYSILCDDMGLEFDIVGDIKNECYLYTNAEYIRQILTIFLENAIKFVTDEGVIQIVLKKQKNKLIIGVKDNGIGIKKETLPYIFERFYKEDKAHSTKGSGLGLAIAREVSRKLNEEINVNSEEGIGSTFSVSIQIY